MRPAMKTIFFFLTGFFTLWLSFRFLMPLCFPFLLGTGLALLAEPVVRLLTRSAKLPRGIASGIGVSAAFVGVTALILLLGAFLLRELGVLAGVLPDLSGAALSALELLKGWVMGLVNRVPGQLGVMLAQNVTDLFSGGTALLNRLFQYLLGLAGTVLSHVPDSALSMGTALISGFMISARLPKIRVWIRLHLPRKKLRPILRTLSRVKTAVGGWLTAQIKLAGMTAVMLFLGLLLLRIPHALVWAGSIALLDAFPVLGTGTVLLPWGLVCLLQGDTPRGVGLWGLYAVISLIRSVLEPKLVGRELGLDPLVTLFALYAGYKLWGLGGMILSPLLAVTAVQAVSGRKELP